MKFESQLQIVTAAGVPPFTVNQTALVINLNADLLDGQHGSYYAAASSLGNYLPLTGGTLTGTLTGTVGIFTTLRATELTSLLGSNGPITITPDGTGHVHINSTDIRLGPNNTNATLATRGTGDLILRTNEGSAVEGFIRIYDGANGNIEITPNGTGTVVVGKLSGSTASFSGQITSTVATGTAPLVITSTTAVTNLNADLLDGQHASYFENRDTTALGFSGGVLTITRAAGNLTANLDGRYLPLTGGTLTGSLALHSNGGSSGFVTGTGDAATYALYNFKLSGWNGMAFENPTTGGAYPSQIVGVVDFRNGTIDMKGGFKINGVAVLTGNQSITLSGDISGTGTTAITATIGANAVTTAKINNSAVTYAKIQNVAVASVLGNSSASVAQAPQEITMATLAGMLSGQTMNIAGNAATATTLQTARTINGTSFNGSANIDTTEWIHSLRDFTNGTLITTNINYGVTNGDPFVLEVRGNSYGNIVPLDLLYQGYIYSDTIINHGGLSNGYSISGLVALNVSGNLCFWFPNQGYWQGYNVKVYAANEGRATNRVTSITNVAKPTGTKEVALSANIRQALHSGNYTSYAPTLTGSGASGTWAISISGTAATATNATQLGGNAAANFVQGAGSRGRSTSRSNGTASNLTDPSGFYYGVTVTGMPTTDWWNWIQSIGNDWSAPDGYGYQLACSYWSDDLRLRRLESGTWKSWVQLLHSGNVGSYALPITGGTVTGNSGVLLASTNDARFDIRTGTAGAWLDIRSETLGYAAVNLYGSTVATGRWSAGMTGGNSNYRITSGAQGAGTVFMEMNSSTNATNFPNSLQQGGNAVLTAASTSAPNLSVGGSAGSVAWTGVTGKPTTLAGYGITDALNTSGTAQTKTGALTINGDVSLTAKVSFGNRSPIYTIFHGGAQDLAWKKIADITFGTALYSAATFRVDVMDANTNFGSMADCKPMTFFVSCRRSGGVLNDSDNALVFGPVADYVRAVKTATGVYELQIRQIADWLVHTFTSEVISQGAGTVTYVTGTPPNGSTTGTVYTATAGWTQRFPNLSITSAASFGGQITSTVATGTAPLVIASTTAVTNLNSDLLDGQHGSYFENRDTTAVGFDSGTLTLTRAAGNLTVSLDGRYQLHRTNISSLLSSANIDQPVSTFDYSNPTGGPAATWINGWISSHSNYLHSIIVNAHRTSDWFVGYMEEGVTNPTWHKLLHSSNFNTYALPLAGGTLTGELSISTGGATGIRVNSPAGNQSFWLRVGYDTDGTATPIASALNTMLQSSGGSAGTFTIVCGNTKTATLSNAAANFAVALQQGGNQVLHAGNYNSYAAGLGTYNTLTAVNQFRSNVGNGIYLGASNTPPLQAFSNDGGAAFMSFHRSGAYAVNMGLDPDNVLRIGGWSASSNRWQLDMSGNQTLAGNLTAVTGLFSGNVGAGTSSPYGKLDLGPDTGRKLFVYGNGGNVGYITGLGVDLSGSSALSFFTGIGRFEWVKGVGNYPYASYTVQMTLDGSSNLGVTGSVTASSFSGAGTGLTGTASSLTAGAVAWTGVTGKPTTLSGYGITDALPLTGGTLTGTLLITPAFLSINTLADGYVGIVDPSHTTGWGVSQGIAGRTGDCIWAFGSNGGTGNNDTWYFGIGSAANTTFGTAFSITQNRKVNFQNGLDVASGSLTQGGNQVLHAGNYNSYALGILGDALTIADWNTLTTFGSRRTAPDGADLNGPPINQYGNLLVYGNSTGVTQLHAGHDGRLAWRTKWNASDWTSWVTALDTGNYTSYPPARWATGRTISLTGDVTGTSGAFDGTANLSFVATIPNSIVTNAKLNTMGAQTIKGNNGAVANSPSDLSVAQVATMLSGQTMNINGSSASCTGNAATATNLSANRTNWVGSGVITAVVGELAWKNYNNGHTIFDASAGTSPGGTAVSNTTAQVAWVATYPTLMGWNGTNTYGVRVDSARIADTSTQLNGQAASYYENRDTTAVGFSGGTLTLTRAAGNLTVSLDGRYLPLSGGTLTGALNVTGIDQGLAIQHNGNTAAWFGRIITKNSTSDKASFLGTYGTVAGVFAHNNALNAWADLYINTVDGSTGGTVRMPSSVLINGNQALHAGNYTSYSPSLTGGGASGTWGINISGSSASCSGNAATCTTANGIADGTVSTTAKLANSVVTYAKIQNVGAASVLGNTSASVSQAPQEITFANLGPYINGVARAWVTFNENPSTGAITINASLGISSVTRINYGQYRVNFSTAFADANYAVSGTIGYESNGGYLYGGFLNIPRVATPKTTTYCEVTASYGDGNTYNARFVHVVFDR